MNSRLSQLKENLAAVQKIINGRAKLLVVSKEQSATDLEMLVSLGVKEFGENKVQDLKARERELAGVQWHFIGHLQSNKVKELLAIPRLMAIHSVDSLALVDELVKRKQVLAGRAVRVYLQVKTSGEDEKFGFENEKDVVEAIKILSEHSEFLLVGLMTMGRVRTESLEKDARECFGKLVELKNKLMKMGLGDKFSKGQIELSMGMSQDFHVACELGAGIVRVGSRLF